MNFSRSSSLYNFLYYRYNTIRHSKAYLPKRMISLLKYRFVKSNSQSILCDAKIKKNTSISFFYSLDDTLIATSDKIIYDNLTPDYSILLNNSLKELYDNSNNSKTVDEIYVYLRKCIDYSVTNFEELKNIIDNKCNSFHEALQRILFCNQLIWQEGHKLVGLGHLDWLLEPFYRTDIENNIISKNEALIYIKEFFLILHEHFSFKSSSLLGDTGQIVILGGINSNDDYKVNELTYLFIQAIQELHLPDPKVLVRVSSKMPVELLDKSIECISTGIGCPLFANDDVIIPLLQSYGYSREDSYNYGTSACWEPFIIGKSVDSNNIYQLNFLKPLLMVFNSIIEDDTKINNYSDLVFLYKKELERYVINSLKIVSQFKWEEYPLLALFIQKQPNNTPYYSDLGFTTVALSNTVNSLLNIQEFIFEKKILSLRELIVILKSDYQDNNKLQNLLKNNANFYGNDIETSVSLANDLFISLSNYIVENQSIISNRKIKVGVSSPSYISLSKNFPASPDGRKKGQPFNVHISNERAKDLTSVFSFAAKLNYSDNRFNGNVIDFMVTPAFLRSNRKQFRDMLKVSFEQGIFEMQINVLDSKTLISAKRNPENYQNLIVRVWGFSAYFNDLPDSYKDVLISRAIESERSYY